MTPAQLNDLAAPIVDALSEAFCSESRGVGILPQRIAFNLSIEPDKELHFLQVLEALLRTNDLVDGEPPVILLVFRWVVPSFEAKGLDQTQWEFMFDVNPRVEASHTAILKHITRLMEVIKEQGLGEP